MKFQRGANVKHKLFVEGKDNQAIDPGVLQELLIENDLAAIDVQAMGSCENVYNAAQALVIHHPSYYFLIDRDDKEQITVDNSWRDFPNPEKLNILIWHKRELENYFIYPDYLAQSRYLKPNINIKQRILNECRRRLFMDAANLTLSRLKNTVREASKSANIFTEFKNHQSFSKQTDGILKLKERSALVADLKLIEQDSIEDIYTAFVNELSGGVVPLQYGSGNWLERMSGKEVFHQIANQCFTVLNAQNKPLNGDEKNYQIARQLVKLPLSQQPADFQQLVALLKPRIPIR